MELELELSVREQRIIVLPLSVDIVAGLRFGVLTIPPRAFDTSIRFLDDDAVSASYYPVTNTYLFVPAVLPLTTVYPVWNHTRGDGMGDADELTLDCFDGDGDGRGSTYDLGGNPINEFGPHPSDGGESA